jgi:hypothetical protein
MGGGHIQRAFVGPGMFACDRLNRIDLRQDFAGDADDLLTGVT